MTRPRYLARPVMRHLKLRLFLRDELPATCWPRVFFRCDNSDRAVASAAAGADVFSIRREAPPPPFQAAGRDLRAQPPDPSRLRCQVRRRGSRYPTFPPPCKTRSLAREIAPPP